MTFRKTQEPQLLYKAAGASSITSSPIRRTNQGGVVIQADLTNVSGIDGVIKLEMRVSNTSEWVEVPNSAEPLDTDDDYNLIWDIAHQVNYFRLVVELVSGTYDIDARYNTLDAQR